MARRKVTVELELEVARANKSAAELVATVRGAKAQIEDLGDEADDTGRDMDQLAANTDVAKRSIDDLGDEARGTAAELTLLDNRIKAAERSVASLGMAFARGDTSVERQLTDERSLLGQLRRIRKEVEAGSRVPRANSSNWFGFDFSNFIAEARGVGIATIIGLAALLAPAIGAMVSGAVVGTVAGGGIIGGVVAAAHDPRVQQAWSEFTPILNQATFGSDALIAPVVEGISRLKSLVQDLDIGETLGQGAGGLNELINGLDLFIRNFWPAFARLMGSSDSILRVFSVGLAGTGSALADFLDDLMESQGTLEGLNYLFMLLNGTIRFLGESLKWLGNAFSGIVRFNAWLSGNVEDVLGWVPWFGSRIREMNDQMENVAHTGTITANVSSGVAKAIAQIPPPAEKTADAIARVNKEFKDMHDQQLAVIDSNLAYQQALDDLSDAVNENGDTLDANTQAGRDNQRALLDGVAAAREQRDANIAAGQYTATANLLYEEQIETLVRQAVMYGLNETAVRNFIAALQAVPPVTTAQLLLEMEARGIVPGEHSGPRIAQNPDYTGSGTTARQIVSEASATGLRQPEVNVDPTAVFLAARAEGRRAAGGPLVPGVRYLFGEQGPEVGVFGQPGYMFSNAQSASMAQQWAAGMGGVSNLVLQVMPGAGQLDRMFTLWAIESIRAEVSKQGGKPELLGITR